jgi:glycosyltransferase involved in cell wall biosynthesis
MERYLQQERNILKLGYGWLECQKVRRWELRACSGLTGVIACSERDRDVLARLCPQARIAVVPNVVDMEDYQPVYGDDDGETMLFVGAMDWLPNRDAVEFFVSAILPELKHIRPDAQFVVAGRNPPQQFAKRFAGIPSVRFTGTVSDLRPLLARAAVCVVPLRIGSGTRIKIIEAAAMGKPVVSTTVGAEGLDFVDGREIVLADEPRTFATAIADLLADRQRRREYGMAARARATKSYSLLAMRETLNRAFDQLLPENRRPT